MVINTWWMSVSKNTHKLAMTTIVGILNMFQREQNVAQVLFTNCITVNLPVCTFLINVLLFFGTFFNHKIFRELARHMC